MSVLDKIKKIKSDKEESDRIATEKSNRLHAHLDKELDELQTLLKKNLMELNGESIGKCKIKITEYEDNFHHHFFKLLINGYHWATLNVERRSYGCGHDYQCDCQTTYRHLIDVKTHNTKGETSGVYFPCVTKGDFDADMFPASILGLIERYDYRNF